MAGYSPTPLVKKLGYQPGMRVLLRAAPAHYQSLLRELPDGIAFLTSPGADLDLVHAFATTCAQCEQAFTQLAPLLAPAGMLWLSWPKRSSPLAGELGDEQVRRIGLASGLVDVKVCAVDQDWSGLKFVRRLRDRPAKRA